VIDWHLRQGFQQQQKKKQQTDIFTIGGGDGNLEELLFGGFGFGFLLSSPPKLRT
jgi:hypothetical protein